MEVPRAQPKPPGDDPVALRWPFAKRHAAEQPPLVEPRGCLKDKKQWESGHTAYKPCLEEPLVLILGRAPRLSTDRCCDCRLAVRPSRCTENLPADARPLQETAQSVGGWDLSWCGVDCLGQRAIQDSSGIRRTSGRPKRLRRVTASVGGGKNIGLVEPMSSIEQRLRRVANHQ